MHVKLVINAETFKSVDDLATILSTKPKLAMFILLPETLIYLKCVYKCYLNPKRVWELSLENKLTWK